jgi:hypothetical protein
MWIAPLWILLNCAGGLIPGSLGGLEGLPGNPVAVLWSGLQLGRQRVEGLQYRGGKATVFICRKDGMAKGIVAVRLHL